MSDVNFQITNFCCFIGKKKGAYCARLGLGQVAYLNKKVIRKSMVINYYDELFN